MKKIYYDLMKSRLHVLNLIYLNANFLTFIFIKIKHKNVAEDPMVFILNSLD
jgi:hypothetical protein